jgi:hypothetical protein
MIYIKDMCESKSQSPRNWRLCYDNNVHNLNQSLFILLCGPPRYSLCVLRDLLHLKFRGLAVSCSQRIRTTVNILFDPSSGNHIFNYIYT